MSNSPSFLTISYEKNIFSSLDKLVQQGCLLDGLVIDLTATGFTLTLENVCTFILYAKKLLHPQGVFLFVKSGGSISLVKDDPAGGLNINLHDSPLGIFMRSPLLAEHVYATINGIEKVRPSYDGSSLANHIFLTTVAVLTRKGHSELAQEKLPIKLNWFLQLVDGYRTLEGIHIDLKRQHHLDWMDFLTLVQQADSSGFIFPVFARAEFLAKCYENKKAFRFGRYLVASGVVSEAQLMGLLEQQKDNHNGKNGSQLLGDLALARGLISARQLELLLADQYLYGGYRGENREKALLTTASIQSAGVCDSMIGNLGAIDTPGLLQSLSTAGKTGLLTVDSQGRTLSVAFLDGKVTHAKLGRLRGKDALVEFATGWSEGIFVFRDKVLSADLVDDCKVASGLNRILLDSALCQDHIAEILAGFNGGGNIVLECAEDFEQLVAVLRAGEPQLIDETVPGVEEWRIIGELSQLIDGITPLEEIIRNFDIWPSHKILKAVYLLSQSGLLHEQKENLFRPLKRFQLIVQAISDHLGVEDSKVLLQSSLHYSLGQAGLECRFRISSKGQISVDISQMRASGESVAEIVAQLRKWMEAYLSYCKQRLEPLVVEEIIQNVLQEQLG
jgi:hypothetical protein